MDPVELILAEIERRKRKSVLPQATSAAVTNVVTPGSELPQANAAPPRAQASALPQALGAQRPALEDPTALYAQAQAKRDEATAGLMPSEAELGQMRQRGMLGQVAAMGMGLMGPGMSDASKPMLAQAIAEQERSNPDPYKRREIESRRHESAATSLEKRAALAQATAERQYEIDRKLEEGRITANQAAELRREIAAGTQAIAREGAAARREATADRAAERAGKLSVGKQKALDDAEIFLSHIDRALASVKANPNALGLKTAVPDVALQRTDPHGVSTRAAVGGLSAAKVHELSGAAVSPAEFARLRPYLPAAGDSAATVEKKLANLRTEAQTIRDRHAGVAPSDAPKPAGAAKQYRLKPGANPDLRSSYEEL